MIKINNNLKFLREKLNVINEEITNLISKRIEIVKQVAVAKKKSKNFYVAERENNILDTLIEAHPEINKDILKTIFIEIMSGCRSYEKVFNVGLLENVYSLTALTKILGSFTNNHYFKTLDSLKDKYYSMDYVIIPLNENFTTFVENIQEIFIINYIEIDNKKFFLMGKKENEKLSTGKICYVLEKENIIILKEKINKFSYSKKEIKENVFLEFNYFCKEELKSIEDIFPKEYKYLGTYPNNI